MLFSFQREGVYVHGLERGKSFQIEIEERGTGEPVLAPKENRERKQLAVKVSVLYFSISCHRAVKIHFKF